MCILIPFNFHVTISHFIVLNVVVYQYLYISGQLKVGVLAGWFCVLTFLAATQDIAVDGWALTMLSKKNVGWASTCNSAGQTIGFFFGKLMEVFIYTNNLDFFMIHDVTKLIASRTFPPTKQVFWLPTNQLT